VQCCGHGLLAVAALLFRQGVSVVRLAMNGSLVEAELEPTTDTIWLTFNSHAALRAPHEEPGLQVAQLSALLGVEPHQVSDVALAGAQDGYLVIRLREECDLTAISPPGPRLARITQRALIATSLLDDAGAIGLRYFAPQHGVPEDSATGSAMRVLARYWADRFQDLTATQFSPAGGELFSSLRGATTRIGGRVVTGE
jgi:predicted PhzF superfamily epimerase YddE/YHI9